MPSSSDPNKSSAHPAWQRLLPWVAGALALALYVRTAAPGLTWAHHGADGGDLIAAAMTWGVPHPSGYPTYILLSRLYALLPLGALARRFTLFSATLAALAVALAAIAIRHALDEDERKLKAAWWPACLGTLGALALAASPALWSQAVITEVYTLHIALVAALLALATAPGEHRPTYWLIVGLVAGLGLGNHLTLALTLPGILVLSWPRTSARGRLAGVAGTLLGLGVYAYVPLVARHQPPVSWGDASTRSGFWWLVSGRLYHRYALAVSWGDVGRRLMAALGLWREQFGLLGVGCTVLGIWSWVEERRWRRLIGMASIWLLPLAYAISYDTSDSMLYLLPCYLVGAIWIVSGVAWLARVATQDFRLHVRWGLLGAILILTALPVASVIRWSAVLDLSGDHEAEMWLDETLAVLPEGAALVTLQDRHTFALWYALYAQNRRPDLLVVDGDLYVEPWYRAQVARQAQLDSPPPVAFLGLLRMLAEERPVYASANRIDLARHYRLTPEGPIWRLAEQGQHP